LTIWIDAIYASQPSRSRDDWHPQPVGGALGSDAPVMGPARSAMRARTLRRKTRGALARLTHQSSQGDPGTGSTCLTSSISMALSPPKTLLRHCLADRLGEGSPGLSAPGLRQNGQALDAKKPGELIDWRPRRRGQRGRGGSDRSDDIETGGDFRAFRHQIVRPSRDW
jgi:hypothetical protein